MIQDIRHSLRALARQPGFVVVGVLSLALGIGVNTAIFSGINGLLLKPLAVRDLDRTVYVYHADPTRADRGTSFAAFERYRDRTDTFSAVMALGGSRPLIMTSGDRREQVYAELVTGEFFAIANVTLQRGRPFDHTMDRGTATPEMLSSAVLSHSAWTRRFGSDPAIVGQAVNLSGRPFTIIGVAAPGFTGLDPEIASDFWIPMATWTHLVGEPARLTSEEHWIRTVAVLKDGVSIEQARAAMAVAGAAIHTSPGQETRVRPVSHVADGTSLDVIAIVASAFAVGLLVLVLACTNVANLLMARAAARQQEMSIRTALGSGRARLVRLWVVESLLLALSAGLLGLVVASWIVDLAVAFQPPTEIGDAEAPTLALSFGLDAGVFMFALGLSALTALVMGLISGLQGSHPSVMRMLKSGPGSNRRFAPGFNVRSAVIAAQMALSMLLLIPCGLFVRSALKSSVADPGFSTDHVILLPIATDQAGVRVQKPPAFEAQLLERVANLPGVVAASAMDPVPLWFGGNNAHFWRDGDDGALAAVRMGHARIAPGYFATLRIPLQRGRDFTPSDTASSPRVAIVNETLARRFWPDRNAVGQRLRDGEKNVVEIVGVARDVKYLSLGEASQPWVYRPLAQEPTNNRSLSLAARTTGDPMALRAAIEREVKALIPAWPIFQFRTLDEGLKLQQQLPRVAATLLGVLGAFGLLLAAIGVYGVMAYVVKQRRHEIGIRLALGSPVSRVLALVMRQGMTVCLVGAAAGVGLAMVGASLMASVFYGVSAVDPLTYLIVPSTLMLVALLACYLPARRIGTISVMDVLREQ